MYQQEASQLMSLEETDPNLSKWWIVGQKLWAG